MQTTGTMCINYNGGLCALLLCDPLVAEKNCMMLDKNTSDILAMKYFIDAPYDTSIIKTAVNIISILNSTDEDYYGIICINKVINNTKILKAEDNVRTSTIANSKNFSLPPFYLACDPTLNEIDWNIIAINKKEYNLLMQVYPFPNGIEILADIVLGRYAKIHDIVARNECSAIDLWVDKCAFAEKERLMKNSLHI